MSAGISRRDYTGIDRYDRLQEPTFQPVDDLSRFVEARIIETELETRETFRLEFGLRAIANRWADHPDFSPSVTSELQRYRLWGQAEV